MSSPSEIKPENVESNPTASNVGGADPVPGEAADAASHTEQSRIEIDESALMDGHVELVEDEVEEEGPDPVAALEEELAATKDRWLRAVADHENYKKRAKRETDEAVQRGVQKLLNDILPVADNLNRALEAVADRDSKISEGISMVQQVFMSALDKNGILPVPGVGSRFDPAHHDAMQQVPSEEYAPGHVVMVFESGFTRHGRLLRPAKVIVSDDTSTGTAAAPDAVNEDA